ncbi:MAG: DUF1848 domain-containing protein [Muribaculaceae bacterium]|nr:DUF1848 domain-containing protein [Muribaculaceae bacterium]
MKQKRVRIIKEDGTEVDAVAPVILSASRATDIPAFYSEWFFNRLERGYCRWRNPFNGADSYVAFKDVRFIVFWSKDPRPLVHYIDRLEEKGIGCYIQYTLNDYEEESLEPGVPPLAQRIETFKMLVDKLGKGNVIWRFDPMILTDKISIDNLLEKVRNIGNQLQDYTEKLVFSFADIASYRKVKSNLEKSGINYIEWNEALITEFARKLSVMNRDCGWNFKLATCGEKINLDQFGIQHNRCIDDELITHISWQDKLLMDHLGMKIKTPTPCLFGNAEIPDKAIILDDRHYALRTRNNRDLGQRKFCGCISAKDIGQYNTCPHGCVYCYANTTTDSAIRSFNRHNPLSETIIK